MLFLYWILFNNSSHLPDTLNRIYYYLSSYSFFFSLYCMSFFSCAGEEYIKSLIGNPELVDRLALASDDQVCIFLQTQKFRHYRVSQFNILNYVFFFPLRMRLVAVSCFSQSICLCPGFRRVSRAVLFCRGCFGQIETTTWRLLSSSMEKETKPQRWEKSVRFLSSSLWGFFKIKFYEKGNSKNLS